MLVLLEDSPYREALVDYLRSEGLEALGVGTPASACAQLAGPRGWVLLLESPSRRPTAVGLLQAIARCASRVLQHTPCVIASDVAALAVALPEAHVLPLPYKPERLSELLWSLCEPVLLA